MDDKGWIETCYDVLSRFRVYPCFSVFIRGLGFFVVGAGYA